MYTNCCKYKTHRRSLYSCCISVISLRNVISCLKEFMFWGSGSETSQSRQGVEVGKHLQTLTNSFWSVICLPEEKQWLTLRCVFRSAVKEQLLKIEAPNNQSQVRHQPIIPSFSSTVLFVLKVNRCNLTLLFTNKWLFLICADAWIQLCV